VVVTSSWVEKGVVMKKKKLSDAVIVAVCSTLTAMFQLLSNLIHFFE
jgi:hypothetical protein